MVSTRQLIIKVVDENEKSKDRIIVLKKQIKSDEEKIQINQKFLESVK